MKRVINGIEYILATCLSGEQFWMPVSELPNYWASDFWDLESAIETTQGVACD